MGISRANQTIAWGLLAVAVLADIAGLVFNLYEKLWWFDKAVHAYFFFSLALVLALYAYGVALTGARDHGLLVVLTVGVLTLGLGGLWEIGEWAYDQVVSPQSVIQGKTDTIIDLMMDTIGGLVAGFVTLRMVEKREYA